MTSPSVKFMSSMPDNISMMTPRGLRFAFASGKLETDNEEIIKTIRGRIACKLDDTREVDEFPVPAPAPIDPRVAMAEALRTRDLAVLNLANNETVGSEKAIEALNNAILAQTAPPTVPTVREPGNGAGLLSTMKINLGSKASNTAK